MTGGVASNGSRKPAIVVHSLEQAEAALRASAAAARPVTLLSAPHASALIGAPALLRMFDTAAAQAGYQPDRVVIGCADKAGHAMSALRAGAAAIVFDPSSPAADRIVSLAAQHGAEVLPPDIYDTAFDPGPVGDAHEACHTYLTSA